jgi:hypothetical protein
MKMPVSPPLNLDAARKDLPIYKIKSRLISEIRQHPALVLLGSFSNILKKDIFDFSVINLYIYR